MLGQWFEHAPGFIALLRGPDHVFETVNRAYYQLVGHRDILDKPVVEALPEIRGQGFEELLDKVYATGDPFVGRGLRVALQRDSGAPQVEAFIDLTYAPVRDASGTITGIFAQGHDVTDHHLAMQALRDSEERFRLAVQSASLGSFEVDIETQRLTWSESAYRMFGFEDAQEMALDVAMQALHSADRPHVEAALASAFDPLGTGEYFAQYRIVRPDGTHGWIEAVGKCRFIGEGPQRRGAQLGGVLWDVTEQHRLIEALQESDRHKDEFLAMLAHELRNPLAPILTAVRLLERTEPLSETGQRAVAMINRQSRQIKRLIDDLLEVSRISQGKIDLQPESMLIGAAIYNAVDTVSTQTAQRSQRIELMLPTTPVRINADPVRVSQILENLLTNASKYTPECGLIRIELVKRPDEVEIRVVDNGMGIERAQIPQLFALFHQIDATLDRSQGGLGIGLAMVKRLVDLHGGSVSAHSEGLGKGATFTVRLPRPQTVF